MTQAGNDASPVLTLDPKSPMQDVYRTCLRIARGDATALLLGETGTGKEVMARYIHANSRRRTGPFIAVNCGAIPESLLESGLFGHVRGAFTGAIASRKGRIASAEGGTLFLDEIGEMPLSLQVRLLRVLQERCVEPLGGGDSIAVDFRLIAATNRELEADVEVGRFRRDLYYRLLVCPLHLPPLRDRPCDIAPLFAHFWAKHGEIRAVSKEVMDVLAAYDWPGNIRELENLVERISVCAENASIEASDLPRTFLEELSTKPAAARVAPAPVAPPASPASNSAPESRAEPAPEPRNSAPTEKEALFDLSSAPPEPAPPQQAPLVAGPAPTSDPAGLLGGDLQLPIDLPKLMRQIEDRYIEAALRASQGNKKGAADMLGLQRTTLVEKLRRRKLDALPEALAPVETV